MSSESVRKQLAAYHMEDRIITLNESSATVALAAQALHIQEAEIAKTMAFMVNEEPVVVVMEGTARVDNHKFKSYFHCKAKMMNETELREYVGHEPGGVTPFGVKEGVKIYLDQSLKHWNTVYPAAGAHNNACRVTPEEIEEITHPEAWIDITKEDANHGNLIGNPVK